MRVHGFDTWVDQLEDALDYAGRAVSADLSARISHPQDPALLVKARLDCDWYAENARCLAAMSHPALALRPAMVFGPRSLAAVLQSTLARPATETWWAVFVAQQPQVFGALASQVFATLRRQGVRVLYYAFDEASRKMPVFREIAPHLDVLIHDEDPLDAAGAAALRPDCLRIHRSWLANVVPFSLPFNEAPEEKIVFLGSQLGLTPHRQRQLDYLRQRFQDRFVAIHDHSLPVSERARLNRYKVSVCPEGRHFATPAMARSHTDRPFWSGCMGLVPVAEDSHFGGRLQELHEQQLILRYGHGDLAALGAACESALAAPVAERRRIYEHFNRHETIGAVVAGALARGAR